MSLESAQKQLLPLIEDHLKGFLFSLDFSASETLQEMIAYHMGWANDDQGGGKRIRPLLTLLCAGAYRGIIDNALPGASAVEYLHNFTLIHDDIEDNAPLRHGKPTVWKKWGMPQAINAGDALFSIAQLVITDLGERCGDSIGLQAVRALNGTCLHLTRGQYMDIAFESREDVSVEHYLQMIEGKTAALIGFAAYLGGLTANQNQTQLNLLSQFGKTLGMAFQIQDDDLGVWGDPEITGKSSASDLLTRKKTLPILYGLQFSDEFCNLWKNEKISPENVDQFSSLLATCGARDYVETKAASYTKQAFEILEKLFPHENIYVEALHELTQVLLNRKY